MIAYTKAHIYIKVLESCGSPSALVSFSFYIELNSKLNSQFLYKHFLHLFYLAKYWHSALWIYSIYCCTDIYKIKTYFGALIKYYKYNDYLQRQEKMRTVQKYVKPSSTVTPVLRLLPEVLPTKDQDKTKFISFELKARAGQPAGSRTYKKFVSFV